MWISRTNAIIRCDDQITTTYQKDSRLNKVPHVIKLSFLLHPFPFRPINTIECISCHKPFLNPRSNAGILQRSPHHDTILSKYFAGLAASCGLEGRAAIKPLGRQLYGSFTSRSLIYYHKRSLYLLFRTCLSLPLMLFPAFWRHDKGSCSFQ